jgi:hypothetical protein
MVKQKSKPNRPKTKAGRKTSRNIQKATETSITDKNTKTASHSSGESKQARLIALLERPEGATIDGLMKATGWQAHSVRGVISGTLKKRFGLTITSEKGGAGRVYRIASNATAA